MSLGPRPWGRALRACRAEGRSSGRSAFEAWAPGIWLETRHPPSPRHRKNLGHFRSESTIHLWHLSSARELFKPRENSKTRAVQQQPCALWWDPIPQTLTKASKQHDPRLKHPPIRPASCADVPSALDKQVFCHWLPIVLTMWTRPCFVFCVPSALPDVLAGRPLHPSGGQSKSL